MRRFFHALGHLVITSFAMAVPGCARTVDSLGDNGKNGGGGNGGSMIDSGIDLDGAPAPPPDAGIVYPNPFRDVLGKDPTSIADKVEAAFQQLFHGDPTNEAIYFPVGIDEAYVEDVRFNTVWAESMGYGMIIAVELDKKEEFDRLWAWTKSFMQIPVGPAANTFSNSCPTMPTNPASGMGCAGFPDAYGTSYIVTSLLLASRRWGNGPNIYNYEFEAQRVLDALPSLFDTTQALAVNGAMPPSSLHATPANQLPAFAELWRAETGSAFWHAAATSARAFWKISTDDDTGLSPGSADFAGTPVSGFETFGLLSYPLAMNVTTDHVWFGVDPWQVSEADKVIAFFKGQGIGTYVDRYSLEGMPQGNVHLTALVAMNGAIAVSASTADRVPFIQAMWDVPITTGQFRYTDGVFYMLSLLVLSGNFRMF